VLGRCRTEGRAATADERAVLARWSGWGALPSIFDADSRDLRSQAARVEELLSPQEWEAARASTLNAHYTSPRVAAAMWQAAVGLGFAGGPVLEPGSGPGVFMATAPQGLDAQFTGVERDPVTAEVCTLLHPDATVRPVAFEDFHTGGFSLAVGNVPFANITPYDPYANEAKLSLHNYFLAKSLQLLEPGGLLVALTSPWTMDASDSKARRELARWGRFLGAVRLPNGAFAKQSGTQVMTDVVLFQRREEPMPEAPSLPALHDEGWARVRPWPEGSVGEGPKLNEWFMARPHLVLGELVRDRGLYGSDELMCKPTGNDVAAELAAALDAVVAEAEPAEVPRRPRWGRPAGQAPVPGAEDAAAVEVPEPPGGWPAWAKEGSLVASPGFGFARIVNGRGVQHKPKPLGDRSELTMVLAVRDAMSELIAAEAADEPEERLDELRSHLNDVYDAYAARFGPLSRGTGVRAEAAHDEAAPPKRRVPQMGGFSRLDPDYPSVLALEVFDASTGRAAKSEIFRQRVVRRRPEAQAIATLSDAVVASLAELGRVDVDWMAAATDWDWEPEDLARSGSAFQDPAAGGAWTPAPLYLAGHVRERLAAARAAAADDDTYAPNVEALAAVLPDDVGPEDITVRLGATWLTPDDIGEFITDVLGEDGVKNLVVTYSAAAGWCVEGRASTYLARTDWGTERVGALSVVEHGLRGQTIVVRDRIDKTSVVNEVATAEANEKLEAWQSELHRWCFGADAERRERLLRAYNHTFRSWVPPVVDGSWVNPPGLREGRELHPHQREAAARIILGGDLLLAHEVGGGKTLTMAAAGMEMRRLGMVNKPAHIVPNHLVEQYAAEIRREFPEAKVLIPFESERTSPDGRKTFVARCATGDWDAVVIPMTTFGLMPVAPEVEGAYIAEQLDEWRTALETLKASGVTKTVKRIEKRIEAERNKLKEALDRPTDDGTLWEHTGIDWLFVDECHLYKNLPIASANSDFATSKGSTRARLLEMKLRWLRETYPERPGVCTLATGTPVANRVCEMWVMQRLVQPEHLRRCGVAPFDAWAATFGKVVVGQELKATGKGWKTASRFASYVNVPELMQLVSVSADFRRAEDMGLERPEIVGGRPEIVAVPSTPELADFVSQLDVRADNLSGKDPSEDNMLLISGDGRKAALHLGLVGLPQAQPSKIEACAARVAETWSANRDRVFADHLTGEPHPRPGALQVVFCDLGVPGSGSAQVCVYDELADSLTASGVPRSQIAMIHDYDGPEARDGLFARCRDGSVSVLMGSTEKMGTGVNIQTRLAALHHLDAAWRPADIEQREGRIVRPGNQFEQVEILRYVSEGSFDTFVWQGLERKARFIGQIYSGRCTERTIDEIDDVTMNYAKVKAAATGDPRIIEHAELVEQITALSRLKTGHDAEQARLGGNVRYWAERLPKMHERLVTLRSYPTAPRHGEALTTRNGRRLDTQAAADQHIRDTQRNLGWKHSVETTLGEIAGLAVRLVEHRDSDAVLEIGQEPAVLTVWLTPAELHNSTTRITGRLHHEIKRIPQHVEHLSARVAEAEEILDVSRQRLGRPFARLSELTEAQARAAALAAAIQADAERSSGDGDQTRIGPVDGYVGDDSRGADFERTTRTGRQLAEDRTDAGDVFSVGDGGDTWDGSAPERRTGPPARRRRDALSR